jgi:hypothetical protein
LLSFIRVSCTPTANGITVRLQKNSIICRGYIAKNFNVISEEEMSVAFNRIAEVSSKYIKQWPKDRSSRNTRKHFDGCQTHTVYSNKRTPVSYVNTQPADITVKEPVGTELM